MSIDHIDLPRSDHGPQPAWHAIYTRHKHEKTVAHILTSRGLETFLPLYTTARRWKDRTKLLSLPLFPCYVFLKGGLDHRLDIVTAPGFHSLVSSAGQPLAIPTHEIEAIRQTIESGALVDPHPFLKCGERVRVKSGPLTGVEGILVRKKNHYRLVVSVEMLGKAVAVEVDSYLVEKASSQQATVRPAVHKVISAYPRVKNIPAA